MSPLSDGGGPDAVLSNNNLINGKMVYDCNKTTLKCSPGAGVSKFRFEAGKVHLLRLINSGAQALQKFSIDNHTMTVIALDFVAVEPYQINVAKLAVGQRMDVLVNATGDIGSAYWMRSNIAGCSYNDGVSPEAVAAIYYNDADTDEAPDSTDTNGNSGATPDTCRTDALQQTVPYYAMAVEEPDMTQTLNFVEENNGTNLLYSVNGSSFRADFNSPTLRDVYGEQTEFPTIANTYTFDARVIRLIFNNWSPEAHPMHLHGHNLQVLAQGLGSWDGTVVRASNPQRRDTVVLPPGVKSGSTMAPGYVVVQWVSTLR